MLIDFALRIEPPNHFGSQPEKDGQVCTLDQQQTRCQAIGLNKVGNAEAEKRYGIEQLKPRLPVPSESAEHQPCEYEPRGTFHEIEVVVSLRQRLGGVVAPSGVRQ